MVGSARHLRRPNRHRPNRRHGCGNTDGFLQAGERLFQRHTQVIAQVRSARGPAATTGTASLTAHEIAEQIVEHIRKRAGEITLAKATARTATTTAHAVFKSGMTKTVIGGLFVGITQHVISLVGFLELRLGIRIVLVAVGMQFLGLLAKALLDLVRRCTLGYAEHIIVVAF